MLQRFKNLFKDDKPKFGALEILKYIGPGFLVTVGFIDPGNWASNVAAGSGFGYSLLWMVTLSTIMLIVLQHNAAHLGIASGLCLSEASSKYFKKWKSLSLLSTAMIASVSTALAEILGAAIGLKMLFNLPLWIGALITSIVTIALLFTNSYKKVEKLIIGFVSIIGLSFIYELMIIDVEWSKAVVGWTVPVFPDGSLAIIMSVMGAVIMPHNIFLHSEVIQSRQWNLENEEIINKQLKYEFVDTLIAMIAGWAINSAMIIIAAAVFFKNSVNVVELEQAKQTLEPLLGPSAAIIFAVALIFAGFSSSITAGMAGGSIFSGIFGEPFDLDDNHSRIGILITIVGGFLAILFLSDPFKGLIWSQIVLSLQLPFTIFSQIVLTSSEKVMGVHKNHKSTNIILWTIGFIVTGLNLWLLSSYIF